MRPDQVAALKAELDANAARRSAVAGDLADRFSAAASVARSEEDLRMSCEQALAASLDELGIPLTASYERRYADRGGRSDAVYGRVVIEYEAVGALSTNRGVRHAAEQLERYLRAETAGSAAVEDLKRVVGVGIDGRQIFFLRFRGAVEDDTLDLALPTPTQGVLPLEYDAADQIRPVLDGPYVVDGDSIQTFLLYLRASSRSRLTAEGLASQFGPAGPCARRAVGTLARLLDENKKHPKVSTFFREWDRIFGIVYGTDLDHAARHLPTLKQAYGLADGHELKSLYFAIHTYYAVLMKLLAAELVAMQRESIISSYLDRLPSIPNDALRDAVMRIESGDLFSHYLVHNFLESDYFGWYLDVWSDEVADMIREMVRLLVGFEPATGTLDRAATQDLLKRLYQYLVPRELRHDLGEFYTPDWLAELALERSGYEGAAETRILDPGCGSGTFLVAAIKKIRASTRAIENMTDETLLKSILANVVGFELNPLAVIAARTNYLLALGPLLRAGPVDLPIYLCDSILAPTEHEDTLLSDSYTFRTAAGVFEVPSRLVKEGHLSLLTSLLDSCVSLNYSHAEFLGRVRLELPELESSEEAEVDELFRTLLRLSEEGRDGVWARIIRNAFAPLTEGQFDFVIGNPPWVNWQSLSADYRAATQSLWLGYGLFSLHGHAARLGGGKKDLSALMLYRSVDTYVRPGGVLTFLITQSLFKSKGAGDGFRRFQIGDGPHMCVSEVQDLTALQPFEGASTQTALVVLRKGTPTQYPVTYLKWRKAGRIQSISSATLQSVRAACTLEELAAAPVNVSRPTSPWLTAPIAVDAALRAVVGYSDYRAFVGVCTWHNGIYWVDVQAKMSNGLLRVRNMAEEAKEGGVEERVVPMEASYVFPLVRSRDIGRWHATPTAYIIVPQDPATKSGIPESTLRVAAPHTYRYLAAFREQLSRRSGMLKYFDADNDAFYSVYNVGTGTFAPYKVMWRQMTPTLSAAVVGTVKDPFLGVVTPVTQHVVSNVAFEDASEAHYFCAVMNCSVTTAISCSYSTGKSYGTPSVLDYLAIPRFKAGDARHSQLAELSMSAHEAASSGRQLEVLDLQHRIDAVAADVYGIEAGLLPALHALVEGLRGRAKSPSQMEALTDA